MVPAQVLEYGDQVAASLREVLGDGLVGVYFVGSTALGGYVPGESDVDIVAVSERVIPDEAKPQIAEAVFDTTAPVRPAASSSLSTDVRSHNPRR
jgi:streptomycin 3"-adenylyltransferase